MPISRSRRNLALAISSAAALGIALTACSGGGGSPGARAECTPLHEFETVNPGELTVAAFDYPPTVFVEGDELSGVEGDLLNEIADRECLKLRVESSGGASASIPSVESGRADIASGAWYRTDERAKITRLSAPLFLDSSVIVSKQGLTMEDLEGKKVASVVGNLWNESFQKWLGDDFSIYQDDESIYADLAAGRIDALVAGTAPSTQRLKDHPIEGATLELVTPHPKVPESQKPGQVNWPTNLDNEPLGEALDENIETLRDEGFIAETLEKWGFDPSLAETGDAYNL